MLFRWGPPKHLRIAPTRSQKPLLLLQVDLRMLSVSKTLWPASVTTLTLGRTSSSFPSRNTWQHCSLIWVGWRLMDCWNLQRWKTNEHLHQFLRYINQTATYFHLTTLHQTKTTFHSKKPENTEGKKISSSAGHWVSRQSREGLPDSMVGGTGEEGNPGGREKLWHQQGDSLEIWSSDVRNKRGERRPEEGVLPKKGGRRRKRWAYKGGGADSRPATVEDVSHHPQDALPLFARQLHLWCRHHDDRQADPQLLGEGPPQADPGPVELDQAAEREAPGETCPPNQFLPEHQ